MTRRRDIKTERNCTPLGDKGLGRLGVQRLGEHVEIFTKVRSAKEEIYLGINWELFKDNASLFAVKLPFKYLSPTQQQGTSLFISELRDL